MTSTTEGIAVGPANRWIMALERGRTTCCCAQVKHRLPFHITILFSTNLNPSDLADSATSGAVPYKSYMPPGDTWLREILRVVVEKRGMQVQPTAILEVASSWRPSPERPGRLAGAGPGDDRL
jgi:hypothetical protein